ncbi:MAG: low molecular weight phosphotyrosine protein phosphatase [Cytophagales bacterium]|nr:low molecular weight phosphotyrosine protein phosphatase [Rhizobacter sp.]
MGNICRSPTAEAVLRNKLALAGLGDAVVVDSAGTHAWHAGSPPDPRSVAHARRRGHDLTALRARAVSPADFESFDFILAMDRDNLALLEERCPAQHRTKLGRLTEHARTHRVDQVPDPYQGGSDGFEHVLDLVEDACDGFIAFLHEEKLAGSGGTS